MSYTLIQRNNLTGRATDLWTLNTPDGPEVAARTTCCRLDLTQRLGGEGTYEKKIRINARAKPYEYISRLESREIR